MKKRSVQTKKIYVISGHNGSGKSTFAVDFLKNKKIPFVNADEIAKSLPGDFENSKIQAGRMFFERIAELEKKKKSFAIESTLSGKYLIAAFKRWSKAGYLIHIVYLFLESPQIAIERIKIRVSQGGHFIPDEDVLRRYSRSLKNFWEIYRFKSDDWSAFYNGAGNPILVASGQKNKYSIVQPLRFSQLIGDKLG